jgi:2,3-dihydroxybenzoate-AMP ligase
MAEGLLTFSRPDDPAESVLTTQGKPISDADEVRIVDEDGAELPAGSIGELITRGPYTLRGYFNVPEHNARTFSSDGFFMTGDLMRKHPSGAYMVEGRKKDLVNRGGEKIGVEEIENLLLAHPKVRNVACVPMPDPLLGERMCAFVVPSPAGEPPTLDELKAHLLDRGLSKVKLPERLELADEFPMSPFGKVSKKELAARIAAALEGETAPA